MEDKKNNNSIWNLAEIWNASLIEVEEREVKARDNLWASELGKAPIDLWLKLRGTIPTNPPNARSLRKFEAGNIFEWMVSLILKRAGILQESQRWSSYQYPGLLKVTGKADFIVGGKPDYERWQKEMETLALPNIFLKAGRNIIRYFAENYPDGLDEIPLEIKSVGSFMFEAMEKKKSSSKIHRIQTYHYLKSENRPKANIVYICRDDLRMMEFLIQNPSPVEEEYKTAIEAISNYHLTDKRPPLEKTIVFDDDIGKFAKNFNVAYSAYLTLLYGFKNQMEFDEHFMPIVARWNRVMARVKEGKEMTAKNTEVLKEITDAGYDVDNIKSRFVETTTEEEQI